MEQWDQQLIAATTEFADVLAHGERSATVPACPGWSLADLAEHLGGIHQWAAHAVSHGTPDGEPTPVPAGRDSLVTWYRDSARQLVDVLTGTPPDAPAWTFGPHPRTANFWRRRQVHETQMHLHDALASQGRSYAFDRAIALDGVGEVVSIMFPRQVRLQRIPPVDGVLVLQPGSPDGDGSPASFVIAGDGTQAPGQPSATVIGPPDALLLLVWKRIGPDDVRLEVTGDQAWATSVLSLALTP